MSCHSSSSLSVLCYLKADINPHSPTCPLVGYVCIGPAFLDLRAFSKWHQEEASVEERNFSRIVSCSSFLLQCSHLVTPLIPTAFCNNGNTSLTFFTFSSSQCHSKSRKREVHRQGWKFATSSSACCCNAVYFKRYVSQ